MTPEGSVRASTGPAGPRLRRWTPLWCLVPCALSIFLLEVLVDSKLTKVWLEELLSHRLVSNERFARRLLVTVALSTFYISLCGGLFAYFCCAISRSGVSPRPYYVRALVYGAAFILFVFMLRCSGAAPRLFCIVYEYHVEMYSRVPCSGMASVRHPLAILLPLTIAAWTVCMGFFNATTIVESVGRKGRDWKRVRDLLLDNLMIMGGLLGVSTVVIVLHFRLPEALYEPSWHASAYRGYANAVSGYWAVVLTAGLLAVYAVLALRLQQLTDIPVLRFFGVGEEGGVFRASSGWRIVELLSAAAPIMAALVASRV